MKNIKKFRNTIILTLLILVLPTFVKSARAANAETSPQASTLCLPGIYLHTTTDCKVSGPSQYLTKMASQGLTFPLQPLPARPPDPDLIYVPYYYGKVVTDNAPIFGSLEAAQKGRPILRKMDSGPTKFISYIHEEVVDGKRYYMITPGIWMTANDVHHYLGVTHFQGLEFTQTPNHAFGWILQTVETKRTPGYQFQDYTGRQLGRFDVVQVYTTTRIGEVDWYQINPNEWLEGRFVSRVIPNNTPPEGVNNGRWIEVNLYEQTVAAYDQNELVFATLTSTGVPPFWTRPGLFQIETKLESTTMQGAFEADRSDYYYLEDVPWTMYYDQARALHGAYWHTYYGYVQSHGCVNLAPGDARWLFEWAEEGDWVYVWDPSGETPVDDDLYGEGGA